MRRLTKCLAVFCACALLPMAAAHKYFFGLTEVSWNPRSEHLEVVHQYTLHDVQAALTAEYGREFRLEQPDAEQKLASWLENHFYLVNSKGKRLTLEWVGYEADFQNIWFYQEQAIKKTDFCGWQASNTLLMDVYSAQVNTVNFVRDEGTQGVTLVQQNSQQSVSCENP